MLIVKMKGGLGNQIFQYAFGRRLAIERGVPLKLDLSWFKTQTLRKFRLEQFKITAEIATIAELKYFDYVERKDIFAGLFRKYQSLFPYYQRHFVKQIGNAYDPFFLNVPKKVLLEGYWQSEQYFKSIAKNIHEEFRLKYPLTPLYQSLSNQIRSQSSVSIHIRRGDYVSNPRTNSIFCTCSSEYYDQAVNLIRSKVNEPLFYIFSDEPKWVQDNFHLKFPFEIIPEDGDNSDVQQLYLISLCKHHIIANSSFSWWGAWLSNSPDKIVIAPSQWYALEKNNRDLLPCDWIKI